MSERLYRFWSRSQQMIKVMDKGRQVTAVFTSQHMGVSRYTTRDAGIASQIRQTQMFKRGEIMEEQEAQVERKPEEQVQPKPRLRVEDKPRDSWKEMNMGGKRNTTGSSAMNAIVNGESGDDKAEKRAEGERRRRAVQMEFFDTGLNDGESREDGRDEEFEVKENEDGAVSDAGHDKIKLEDVQTLMDAKEYLKEVLGATAEEVRLKSDMQEYCQRKGVVFPNYSF